MGIKRLFLILSFFCWIQVQATSVVFEHDGVQEPLDLDHIEPLSCATYADLISSTHDSPAFIARLVSCAHEKNYIHYVDAHLLHTALFHGDTPSIDSAPKILFNPVNNLPLTENISYFALYVDHADYLGTLTDVYTQTPAGEFIIAYLDAHYAINDIQRAYGQYALGRCYQAGNGVARDAHRALDWYTQALKHADTQLEPALWYALACVYEMCTDIPDYALHALTYYTKAAENKHDAYSAAAALYALGTWYTLYNHDGKSADGYYQKALALAPDSSLITAIKYAQATLYYQGKDGIPRDYKKAAELFEAVACSGDNDYKLPTALALGELYRTGGYGLNADSARAYTWYNSVMTISTVDDHGVRMARFGLAELYRADNNRVKAQTLYNQLLAECTDADCMQPMIYNGLASLYCFSCDQIAADYVKAQNYYTRVFEKAANKQARAVAANGLATLYYHGTPSIAQDIEKAVNYYRFLTNQDQDLFLQAHAYQMLGAFYVKSDLDQAITYLQQAAEQTINKQAQQQALSVLKGIHEQSVHMASRASRVLQQS